MIFNDLLLTGQLGTYLADLNEQAQNRLQRIIRQMQEAENVTDELKGKDQMAWLRAMNSIICNTLAIRCLRMSKLGKHCFPNLGVFGQSV